ncbi:MAG: glycosyltransferase [Candidatus Diapherotrites archaeon]|nr:glycosyltransferase [Candidatus Diapherotrites archaeon]
MKQTFSIIINAFNEEKDLAECIRSLKKQSVKPLEIIVIDNGSKDNTAQIAKNERVKVFTIKPRSRGLARDYGWKVAKGTIVAYLDADMIVNEDWVKEILKKFDTGADGVIDRIRVWNPNNHFTKSLDAFYKYRVDYNYVPFLAWAFKRKLLKEVGGFMNTWIEDGELGKRFLKAGYKIMLAEKAIRYHKGPPRTFSDMLKRNYFFGKNEALSIYKNHPETFPRIRISLYLGFIALEILAVIGAIIISPLTLIWIPLSFFLMYFILCFKFLFINGAYGKVSITNCLLITVSSFLRALIWPAGIIKGYYFTKQK